MTVAVLMEIVRTIMLRAVWGCARDCDCKIFTLHWERSVNIIFFNFGFDGAFNLTALFELTGSWSVIIPFGESSGNIAWKPSLRRVNNAGGYKKRTGFVEKILVAVQKSVGWLWAKIILSSLHVRVVYYMFRCYT